MEQLRPASPELQPVSLESVCRRCRCQCADGLPPVPCLGELYHSCNASVKSDANTGQRQPRIKFQNCGAHHTTSYITISGHHCQPILHDVQYSRLSILVTNDVLLKKPFPYQNMPSHAFASLLLFSGEADFVAMPRGWMAWILSQRYARCAHSLAKNANCNPALKVVIQHPSMACRENSKIRNHKRALSDVN